MAIRACPSKELIRLDHVERVEDGCTELDVSVMTGTVEGGESTGRAAER